MESIKNTALNVLSAVTYLLFVLMVGLFSVVTLNASPPAFFLIVAITTLIVFIVSRPLKPGWAWTLNYLQHHSVLAIVLMGLLALLINSSLGSFIHYPIPAIRDEFAYLLGADTFANGSLTNPTHPFWNHFTSAHIFHEPSYQSKYPPGQSLILAVGKTLTGLPAAGVWLSMALGTGALLWMLLGWVPARWAILGSLLFLMNAEVFRQWGQSYWGGGVALTGGCLVFGAVPRLLRSPKVGTSIWLSVGIIILAFSRPLEGGLASISVLYFLSAYFFKSDVQTKNRLLKNVVTPLLVAGVIGSGMMTYYNKVVTGSAFKLPYQVWLEQQGIGLTQTVISAVKKIDTLPDYQDPGSDKNNPTAHSFAQQKGKRTPIAKLARNFQFYIGITLAIPLLLLPMALRLDQMKFAGVTCLLVFAGVFSNAAGGFPHYLAPIACLIVLLLVQSLRLLSLYRYKHYKIGRKLVQIVPIFALCAFLTTLVLQWIPNPVSEDLVWSLEREKIRRSLLQKPGKHLVLVRYSSGHPYNQEWVYNDAMIDQSKIVWAKSLNDGENKRLMDYFKDHTKWEITPEPETSLLRYGSNTE